MLIKICCIQNDTEVEMAAAAGATHVGLVAAMPSGPGPIAADRIAEIVGAVPTGVTAVLLTAHTDADSIIGHARTTGVTAVQIVGEVPADVRLSIKAAAGSIDILQVVHVGGPEALEQAQPAAVGSDFVLLDSGRPSALVPELGGTGRTHDWAVSAQIVSRLDVPVFLAGGLGPENVAEAIRTVRPAGVDLCSGIRDPAG
ncbi:MAG: phosphoribosylanthranilate isomerase [Gemmatimonadetes bacterium]|nr:phosphoribosylanthranilate isomerase [Gemmatimonadota bacterium]